MVDPITFSVLAAIAANRMLADRCPRCENKNWMTQTKLPSGLIKCGRCAHE